MDIMKIDIFELDSKARKIIEVSDQDAIKDLFGECETIEDINSAGESLYDEIFG